MPPVLRLQTRHALKRAHSGVERRVGPAHGLQIGVLGCTAIACGKTTFASSIVCVPLVVNLCTLLWLSAAAVCCGCLGLLGWVCGQQAMVGSGVVGTVCHDGLCLCWGCGAHGVGSGRLHLVCAGYGRHIFDSTRPWDHIRCALLVLLWVS
jgi:hypothetical protein